VHAIAFFVTARQTDQFEHGKRGEGTKEERIRERNGARKLMTESASRPATYPRGAAEPPRAQRLPASNASLPASAASRRQAQRARPRERK